MTVQELIENMTIEEYNYWIAFFKLEEEKHKKEKMKNDVKGRVK